MSSTGRRGLFGRGSTYSANAKERIDIGYVSIAEPDAVLGWLRTQHAEPEQGVYGDMLREPEPRKLLEYVLLRRRHKLIDYGLARYGCSDFIIQKVYDRAPVGTRLAALANPRGSMLLKQAAEILKSGKPSELAALFSNPYLHGGLFENLFERKEAFEGIDNERFATLVHHASGHPRLARKYDSLVMDGYDDYSYHRAFAAAWQLTMTVPTTKQWAWLLERLLNGCLLPVSFDNVDAALERWRIDEPQKEDAEWYNRGAAFFVRVRIASLIREDEKLLANDDPALRMAFYKRLDPYKHKRWTDFFDKDGAEFVHYALENEGLWRTEDGRAALRQLCWRCPDKHSSMDYPNDFRVTEKRMQELHPQWFAEEEAPKREDGNTTGMREDPQIVPLLQELLQRVHAIAARNSGAKGWWVAAGLFVLLLFK